MITTRSTDRLASIVGDIDRRLALEGIEARSMIHAGSLEEIDAIRGDADDSSTKLFHVTHLEDRERLEPIPVPRIPSMESKFRYFVDGAQKTYPVWRFGTVPIIVSITAAGVLERGPGEVGALLKGSLRDRVTWLIPRETGNPDVDRLVAILNELPGTHVEDPVRSRVEDIGGDYALIAGNYLEVARAAYRHANGIRSDMEADAVGEFEFADDLRFPDGWLLIDGRYHGTSERAVGLIKDLATQFVRGEDILTLFDLAQGHRTSAARFTTGQHAQDADRIGESNTNWYMRLWNATGQDARHALVRIEAPHHIEHTSDIDLIASWLYAERLPRATEDPRWPTLQYPIHILEKILKRRLAALTSGWPA